MMRDLLDLVPHRRALAEAEGRVTRRRRRAPFGYSFNGNASKARAVHPRFDQRRVLMTVRRAREEQRRILWEQRRDRLHHHIREIVRLDTIPHIEHEPSAQPQPRRVRR
jgi:hypothetical protein